MKYTSNTIGNQTHDLPVCSAVPQPTACSVSCRPSFKHVWEHPHSHLPIHRYASQHVSQCRSTHITTFQLTVIHHSNATSLSVLLSLRTPVSAHNSRNKRRFPSQLLTQHFGANSHAYQTYQPTNGRADEQRENHIKRPRFQPERQPTSQSFSLPYLVQGHLGPSLSHYQPRPSAWLQNR